MNDKRIQSQNVIKSKNQQLTENFWAAEFQCRCGCGVDAMDPRFMLTLQAVRSDFNRPMIISSGARCPKHNREVGGAKYSAHICTPGAPACAADITTLGLSGELKYELLRLGFKYGFRGIGISRNFLHFDLKINRRSIWTY